ncbi:kinase-like domain-containing protein [Melampsora americana]|nr:kinase-like domain-containing protein [Melampsora americana]
MANAQLATRINPDIGSSLLRNPERSSNITNPQSSKKIIPKNGSSLRKDYERLELDLLEEGECAESYKVKSKSNQKIHQIKVLPISQESIVMHEVNVLKDLSHPNIVEFTSLYRTRTEFHIVLDYFYDSLRAQVALTERQVKVYSIDIAHALDYLHKNNIIHTNVSLETVWIAMDGRAVLSDFEHAVRADSGELAQIHENQNRYTITPEAIDEEPCTISMDWWGLGVMIYEMVLEDRVPWGMFRDDEELFKRIKTVEPYLPPRLPWDFQFLILWLLNKNPNDRLNSLDSFLASTYFKDYVPQTHSSNGSSSSISSES